MNEKKFIERGVIALLAFLAVATYKGWILWPYFYNAPYYKVTSKGFEVSTRENDPTWANIHIREDVVLRVSADCPMSEKYYKDYLKYKTYNRNCKIKIFLNGKNLNKVNFENHTDFKVEGISVLGNLKNIDIKASVKETKEEWVWIELKNKVQPSKLRVQIPALIINGEVQKSPIITGKYMNDVEFYNPFFRW